MLITNVTLTKPVLVGCNKFSRLILLLHFSLAECWIWLVAFFLGVLCFSYKNIFYNECNRMFVSLFFFKLSQKQCNKLMYNNYILSLILNQFMHQDKSTAQNRSIICKRMCKFDIYPNFIMLHAIWLWQTNLYLINHNIHVYANTITNWGPVVCRFCIAVSIVVVFFCLNYDYLHKYRSFKLASSYEENVVIA